MTVEAKICGVSTAQALAAAVAGGARYVGLVFYPASPRNVTADEAAALARLAPEDVIVVGLLVEPDDATLDGIAAKSRIDLWQLHGAETPARGVADRLLFDAKVPAGRPGLMPGGNAISFDWSVLADRRWPCPWMLSGGLDADNVAEAVNVSGAPAVDVSSGVESAPGLKDAARIKTFLQTVAAL
jgi:phosphoribosylanthranilate isomerase